MRGCVSYISFNPLLEMKSQNEKWKMILDDGHFHIIKSVFQHFCFEGQDLLSLVGLTSSGRRGVWISD